MLTLAEARARATERLAQPDIARPDLPPFRIRDEYTVERPDICVFFWDVPGVVVGGNAPLLVHRATGRVTVLGTAYPLEWFLANLDRTGDPFRAS